MSIESSEENRTRTRRPSLASRIFMGAIIASLIAWNVTRFPAVVAMFTIPAGTPSGKVADNAEESNDLQTQTENQSQAVNLSGENRESVSAYQLPTPESTLPASETAKENDVTAAAPPSVTSTDDNPYALPSTDQTVSSGDNSVTPTVIEETTANDSPTTQYKPAEPYATMKPNTGTEPAPPVETPMAIDNSEPPEQTPLQEEIAASSNVDNITIKPESNIEIAVIPRSDPISIEPAANGETPQIVEEDSTIPDVAAIIVHNQSAASDDVSPYDVSMEMDRDYDLADAGPADPPATLDQYPEAPSFDQPYWADTSEPIASDRSSVSTVRRLPPVEQSAPVGEIAMPDGSIPLYPDTSQTTPYAWSQ